MIETLRLVRQILAADPGFRHETMLRAGRPEIVVLIWRGLDPLPARVVIAASDHPDTIALMIDRARQDLRMRRVLTTPTRRPRWAPADAKRIRLRRCRP